MELIELDNYSKFLINAKKSAERQNFKKSMAKSLTFFLIFAFYSYGLYVGGRLRWEGVRNDQAEYSSGTILTIMFAIIFSAMQLG